MLSECRDLPTVFKVLSQHGLPINHVPERWLKIVISETPTRYWNRHVQKSGHWGQFPAWTISLKAWLVRSRNTPWNKTMIRRRSYTNLPCPLFLGCHPKRVSEEQKERVNALASFTRTPHMFAFSKDIESLLTMICFVCMFSSAAHNQLFFNTFSDYDWLLTKWNGYKIRTWPQSWWTSIIGHDVVGLSHGPSRIPGRCGIRVKPDYVTIPDQG